MIKHIGKISDRKVAIVFREVPGEEHMALIIYPDTMPVHIHDSVMRVLESPEGQAAENLGDAMFRNLLSDGRPMLQTLHSEGMIKKVQAKQVIVTPTPASSVNLEEMNRIINELKTGEAAVKRLSELDAQRGMTGAVRPKDEFGRELGAPPNSVAAPAHAPAVLDNATLATQLATQAERMAQEAQQLLAESQRLKNEAATLVPAPAVKRSRVKKKSVDASE